MTEAQKRRARRKVVNAHKTAGRFAPRPVHPRAGPKGISSCVVSTTPRFFLEMYSLRKPGDVTIGSYCRAHFMERAADIEGGKTS